MITRVYCLICCLLNFVSEANGAEKTNIVFLLADDLGYGDLACYGAPDVRTPHLDGLAKRGTRFTQHYSNGPECSPTRTALLTGRYQQRAGGLECAIGTGNVGRYDDAIRLAQQHELGLPVTQAVLPREIKKVGYQTAIFGKWHLGYEPKFNPLEYGFDSFFGCLGGNVEYFTHVELSDLPVLYRDRQPVERPGYMTHLLADDAVQFLRENRSKPFFLYVPLTAPHFPFQGPDDHQMKFTAENWTRGTRATYVKMVDDMDQQIGRILDTLSMLHLTENTLVIFASDNGAMAPGRNLPMSNQKGTLYEGGIRVPLIISWPGKIPENDVSRQTCMTMDLTRSLLNFAGAGDDLPLDGIDIIAHIQGNKPDRERTLFWRSRRGNRTERAIRFGDIKYLHRALDDGTIEEKLFDLAADPSETRDLLSMKPALATTCRDLLAAWENEVRPSR